MKAQKKKTKFQKKYEEYLSTDVWKEKRAKAIKKTPYCALCSKRKTLQVHHRKYPLVFGDEPISWLTVLCSKCHSTFHGIRRAHQNKQMVERDFRVKSSGQVKIFNETEKKKYIIRKAKKDL
jgi:hypothetical protein